MPLSEEALVKLGKMGFWVLRTFAVPKTHTHLYKRTYIVTNTYGSYFECYYDAEKFK